MSTPARANMPCGEPKSCCMSTTITALWSRSMSRSERCVEVDRTICRHGGCPSHKQRQDEYRCVNAVILHRVGSVKKPAPRTRRADKAEHTRRRIVAAASELFAERGFAATTIDDIARHADV